MKGVLFISLVGAAIYMALVVSHDQLPVGTAEDSSSRQRSNAPTVRQLRSWGTDLPSLVSQRALPRRNPRVVPGPLETAHREATVVTNSASYEPIEWAKVILAARAHSVASVSSPTVRFYQPGAALQIISRQNGWVEVTDPTSREGGWVLEQYLMPVDGPTVTQTAMATTTSKALSEPAPAKPPLSAKKRPRARPAVRVPEAVASAQFGSRLERRAEPRRGFGLFFFRRSARAD
jgi:hypothetical protein